jgi:hypothetical protein
MYAVTGRVKIKSGHEDETRAMIGTQGIAMVQGMVGSSGGYWARSTNDDDLVQHSLWLFDTEENASGGGDLQHSSRYAGCTRDLPRR